MIENFSRKIQLYTATYLLNSTYCYTERMKTNGNDKALESYKIFPLVAWGITFAFAFFVYNITSKLQAVVQDLQIQTQQLQEKVNTPVEQIEDFGS